VSCPELTAAIDYAESKGTIFVDVHPEMIRVPKQADRECVPGECDARILHSGVVAVPNHGAEPEASRDVYVWPYPMDPGYKDGWGYSQGPPEVAGVVALMKSVNPKLTPQEIRDIVKKTARPLDGFAVLDAEAAVSAAGGKDAAGR
jgi:subtilisin family serine protease